VTLDATDPCLFRLGTDCNHQILIIPPLFEELNRTRRMIAEMMHGLLAGGIGSTLIDLPGTGESLLPSGAITLDLWCTAIRDVAKAIKPVVIASLRGGALVDDAGTASGCWRFAPETGARIVRDLERSRLASADGSARHVGHALSEAFVGELRNAVPSAASPLRTVRLDSDAAGADAHIPGSPLWRRAEPGEDAAMTASLVADLAGWVTICAAL
jgi:hypothetical protein